MSLYCNISKMEISSSNIFENSALKLKSVNIFIIIQLFLIFSFIIEHNISDFESYQLLHKSNFKHIHFGEENHISHEIFLSNSLFDNQIFQLKIERSQYICLLYTLLYSNQFWQPPEIIQ
jgi:hypothetical protein